MSTITESPYDLYANFSTAAAYATPANVSTLSTGVSASENASFTDLMLAEVEAAEEDSAASDETTDTEGADVGNSETDDTDGSNSNNSSSNSTTGTDTSNNSNYYREDIYAADTASDELSFMDMLQLMLLQFQNQTIDNTASTTDMMNQLTQMTTMQAMTSMEDSITEMTATNAMLYNSQLVGQEVTVGYYDSEGNFVEEVGIVAASGYYDGVPVVFFEGQTAFHTVSSIMAIGRLPETPSTDDEGDDDSDDTTVDGSGEAGDNTTSDSTDDGDTTVGGDLDVGGSDSDTSGDSSSEVSTFSSTNFVDYSSMSAEELLAASQNALG